MGKKYIYMIYTMGKEYIHDTMGKEYIGRKNIF